jgi:hypothetical protein
MAAPKINEENMAFSEKKCSIYRFQIAKMSGDFTRSFRSDLWEFWKVNFEWQ